MSGEVRVDHGIGTVHEAEIIRDLNRERDVRAIAVLHLLMVLAILAQGLWALTGVGHSPGFSGLGGYIILILAPVYAIVIVWGLFIAAGLWRYRPIAVGMMLVWVGLEILLGYFMVNSPFPFLSGEASDLTVVVTRKIAGLALSAYMLTWWSAVVYLLRHRDTRPIFTRRYRKAISDTRTTLEFYRSPYFYRLFSLAAVAAVLLWVAVLAGRASILRSRVELETWAATQRRNEAKAKADAEEEAAAKVRAKSARMKEDDEKYMEYFGDPYLPLHRVADVSSGDWEELRSINPTKRWWLHRYEIGNLKNDLIPVDLNVTNMGSGKVFSAATRFIPRSQPELKIQPPSESSLLEVGGRKFACTTLPWMVDGKLWGTVWLSATVKGIGVVAIAYPSGLKFELTAYGQKDRVLWRNPSYQAHSVQAGPARPKARPTTMMVAPKTR